MITICYDYDLTSPQAGKKIGEHYTLRKPIDSEAPGSVWDAEYAGRTTPVAIRFVTDVGLDEQERAQFNSAAARMSRLRSPHIERVLDHGIEDGAPYLVSQRVHGDTLRSLLERSGPLEPVAALELLRGVANGLIEVHGAGIVHGNLSPSSLVIARTSGERILKLVDFDLSPRSCPSPDQAMESGIVTSSTGYLSPEQIMHRDATPRSDLFSLGVLLFEAMSGVLPTIPGPGVASTPRDEQTSVGLVAPMSEAAPHLSTGFDAFFRRALQSEPQQRFASAGEMLTAFVSAVENHYASLGNSPTMKSAVPLARSANSSPPAESAHSSSRISGSVSKHRPQPQVEVAPPPRQQLPLHAARTPFPLRSIRHQSRLRDLRGALDTPPSTRVTIKTDPRNDRVILGGLAIAAFVALILALVFAPRQGTPDPAPPRAFQAK